MSAALVTSGDNVKPAVRRLWVIWKDPQTGRNHKVGRLEELPGRTYVFRYDFQGKQVPEGFTPLLQFPDLDGTYSSSRLPAFFRNRVMNRRRESVGQYLDWIGVHEDDPLEEVSRTGGVRATDPITLVDAFDVVGGHCQGSGLQHKNAIRHLDELWIGEELVIEDEPSNPYNPQAMLLIHDHDHRYEIGWIPNWLVDEVQRLRRQGLVQVFVAQINHDAPSHLALLCRMEASIPVGAGKPLP